MACSSSLVTFYLQICIEHHNFLCRNEKINLSAWLGFTFRGLKQVLQCLAIETILHIDCRIVATMNLSLEIEGIQLPTWRF